MKIGQAFKVMGIYLRHFPVFFMHNVYIPYFMRYDKKRFGMIGKGVRLDAPIYWSCPQDIYLEDYVHISPRSVFIMSPGKSKFVMKPHSGAAPGLTVITNAHTTHPPLDVWRDQVHLQKIDDYNADVIIEEEVWIGANVTIMPGVTIGRGAIIGACSLVTKSIPPYAIAVGTPAKVVRYKYSPEEIIEHEKIFYKNNL